jgi:hypothetical protein
VLVFGTASETEPTPVAGADDLVEVRVLFNEGRVRWDGTTFWTWSGTAHRDLVYTNLQEG